jgi:hypothetical protein
MILHTRRDRLSAINLDYHYDTYHLAAVYLAEPEASATQTLK